MNPTAAPDAGPLGRAVAERTEANGRFFAAHAPRVAELCLAMARRFASGGRLLALGSTPAARSDARHVAVEFVHPVIVGKRALPALALIGDGAELERRVGLLAGPSDIVLAYGEWDRDGGVQAAVARARERGCLTVAFAPAGAEWEFDPPSGDRFIRQELVETLYHELWELVHVFFEHRGLLEGRSERRSHDAGASAFLYPFLDESERDADRVLEDVRASALMKADDIGRLRAATLSENRDGLAAAVAALRASFAAGGKLLALGNGGSATDAMDLVADLVSPAPGRPPRPALDLTDDPSVLTAIANDIGVDAIFSRQVIAHGAPGDTVVALTTSGNSANVIEALQEARRRRLVTVALVGYDGGRIAAEGLADHVIVVRSEYIPRIQEAQASAYHVLCDLLDAEPPPP